MQLHFKSDEELSNPFIIVVENRSYFRTLKDVDIINVAKQLWPQRGIKAFFRNLILKVSYGIPNITFKQFLCSLMFEKIEIGLIRSICKSEKGNVASSHGVQQVFNVIQFKMNGAFVGKPYIPTLDNYQFQQGQIDSPTTILLDSNTQITLESLAPRTTYIMQLWPMKTKHKKVQVPDNTFMGEELLDAVKNTVAEEPKTEVEATVTNEVKENEETVYKGEDFLLPATDQRVFSKDDLTNPEPIDPNETVESTTLVEKITSVLNSDEPNAHI